MERAARVSLSEVKRPAMGDVKAQSSRAVNRPQPKPAMKARLVTARDVRWSPEAREPARTDCTGTATASAR